jgi:hypothetical protein
LRKSGAELTAATRRETTNAPLPFAETGGAVVLDFISEQLEDDLKRRQSFEQRGLALVASAGGFVTILFGLLAIAARNKHRGLATVPHSARSLVIAALPLLFASAGAGIAAGFPLRYIVPKAASLDHLVADDIWRGSGVKTAQRIAEAKLKMLTKSRARTRFKGWALIVGFLAELIAVALVAIAVAKVL